MPAQNSNPKSPEGQVKSTQANLVEFISSAAEKDTRVKPWQSGHKDGQATVQDGDQDRGAKTKGKDEYWIAEGSVNATS